MAGTTADKLALASQNKAAIKAAISAKNPTVAPTNVMSQWPTAIASIPTGGVAPETLRVDDDGNLYCMTDRLTY